MKIVSLLSLCLLMSLAFTTTLQAREHRDNTCTGLHSESYEIRNWHWFTGGIVRFHDPDQFLVTYYEGDTPRGRGRWACSTGTDAPSTVTIWWESGYEDQMQISESGWHLDGQNQNGTRVSASLETEFLPCAFLRARKWCWFNGGAVYFGFTRVDWNDPDLTHYGTLSGQRNGETWHGAETSCKRGAVRVEWEAGFIDQLILSRPGPLRGRNQYGTTVTADPVRYHQQCPGE